MIRIGRIRDDPGRSAEIGAFSRSLPPIAQGVRRQSSPDAGATNHVPARSAGEGADGAFGDPLDSRTKIDGLPFRLNDCRTDVQHRARLAINQPSTLERQRRIHDSLDRTRRPERCTAEPLRLWAQPSGRRWPSRALMGGMWISTSRRRPALAGDVPPVEEVEVLETDSRRAVEQRADEGPAEQAGSMLKRVHVFKVRS
jgi:hypothetical protein